MTNSSSAGPLTLSLRLAEGCLWLLLLTVWWIHDATLVDPFRLPKLVASETLVLLSVIALAVGLWTRRMQGQSVSLVQLWRWPAVRLAVPFLAVALVAHGAGEHPLHGMEALRGLALGSLALVAWSLGFSRRQMDRLLRLLAVPAALLAVVALFQLFGWMEPFAFDAEVQQSRVLVTSFAGSSGDLAMFLVIPGLLAQRQLYAAALPGAQAKAGLWVWGLSLALTLTALVAAQNLTALLALGAGSALFWGIVLPRRRFLWVLGGLLLAAVVLAGTVAPLRDRVVAKARQLENGQVNAFLTGRLDGWHAALWMFQENPLLGVGPGGYQAEFAQAKLALVDDGVVFLRKQEQVMFADAHNEYLEVAAEMGLAGLLALGWGIFVFLTALRRWPPEEAAVDPRVGNAKPRPPPGRAPVAKAPAARRGRTARGRLRTLGRTLGCFELEVPARAVRAFAWAGTLGLGTLALSQFPFRIALAAYPAVLFLAWVLVASGDPGREAPGP